jgi:D-lyxose ketol-isomerase
MTNLPFHQKKQGQLIIREFSSDVNSEELVWHRDRKNRIVKVQASEGWQLQMENCLPVNLESGESYYIPQNTYHRVIKGKKCLVVEIKEL